nr:uncharacterized protein LOC111424592 [Onthophagus taurus]
MTQDELIRNKLKPGKFIFYPSGIIKVLGLVFIFAGVTFYISLQPEIKVKVFVYSVANIVIFFSSFILYMIFTLGHARQKPWMYLQIDIVLNIFLPIIGIICVVIAKSPTTSNNSTKYFPLGFGITGNVLLLISAATMFMFYRYKGDNYVPPEPLPERRKTYMIDARPSVHI